MMGMAPRLKGLSAVYAVVPEGFGEVMDILVTGRPETVMRDLAGLGYGGVELNIADPFRFDPSTYRRLARSNGLEIAAISTGLSRALLGVSLAHPVEGVRRRSLEAFKRYIEVASQLDSEVVVVGIARGSCVGDCGGARERLRASLETLSDLAKSYGVVLAVEPINRYEIDLVNTVGEALDLIEGLDSTGLLVDTFHSTLEEPSPYQAVVEAGGRMVHLHVADSNRRAPGLGIIDWARIARALRHVGYAGYASVEARVMPDYRGQLEIAARTLSALLE